MKTKIIIWLIVIILLMGLGFWLFFPRTAKNEPVREEDIIESSIVVDSNMNNNINVYVKDGAKNLVGSQAIFAEHLKYSLTFKAYLDSSFETPIWFYCDDVRYSTNLLNSPIETFGAKFYVSEDSLNFSLLYDWYYDFNSQFSIYLPGNNDQVLLLKFNTFNGGLLNLFKTFSYSPAHFGEIFDKFIREDFVKNEELKQTNKYDFSKFFSVYVKNEEGLYQLTNDRLIFDVNFKMVDSLDEIVVEDYYNETLLNFTQQEMILTLNKQNTTLTWDEIDGADKYVIRDLNNENFVFNSNTNSFNLNNVETNFWAFPNTTKKLYVYGFKEILNEDIYYYENAKTLDSNVIEINFNYISSDYNGGTVYDVDSNELRFDFSSAVGMNLLNKTYEIYINDILVATTQNTYLSLENLEFEQNLETGQNIVQVKCFSNDFKFASATNDLYFLDSAGLVANCEFPVLSDRFVGKPTNLSFDENNILSWTGVEWAENYTIRINGLTVAILSANTLTFDFSSYIEDFQFGNNTLSVFAMLNDWQISVAGYDFVYEHYSSVQYRNGDVETPNSLFFGHPYMSSAWTLTWNGLDPQVADYYEIKIEDYILTSNTKLSGVNKFTINLSNQNLILSGGDHSVCVRAKIGDLYSEWSESISLPVLDTVSQINYNDETKQLTFLTPETTTSLQFFWTVEIINSQGVSISRPIIQSQGSVPTVNSGEIATIDLSGIAPGTYTIKIYVHNWSPTQTQIFTCQNMTPIEIQIG